MTRNDDNDARDALRARHERRTRDIARELHARDRRAKIRELLRVI